MIKVALVGIGGMGFAHFGCYTNNKINDIEVIAVCDIREDMARKKVNNSNIKIYGDIDEMLEKENPDIVDICTPTYMHKQMSIKALNSGANVICEKPMSLSSEDADEIIKVIEKKGKLFMTAHVVRFMTPYLYLKETVESKELGELLRLDMKRISSAPKWSWDNWMLDTEKSGGTPFDLSVHDIDFVNFMLGEPKDVKGAYYKLKNNNDFLISQLIYDNCIVSTEGTWYDYEIPFSASFKAVFTNGTLEYADDIMKKNGEPVEIKVSESNEDLGINIKGNDAYFDEIEYFVSCVRNKEKPKIITPECSRSSVKIVERILENSAII